MRTIKKLIITTIKEMKWRKINKHNDTFYVNITDFNCVSVGKGTYGPIDVLINVDKYKLNIGNYCSIADDVRFILSSDHPLHRISTYPFNEKIFGELGTSAVSKGDIIVHDDVWIGTRSIILSGVEIGQGAVIAAGSIVTKDVPPYAIVAGIPAKIVKYRFSEDLIKELLKIDFSKIDDDLIKENKVLFNENIESVIQIKKIQNRWEWTAK
ncbi:MULTISPECIES: CatB-related O-acetyltransferase [Coprobacillaceae]|uniref:CatB-related O-acetyltransferase n=1 Tax=Coprobacillaceae TaxID=2810280 RepID=UPI0018F65602|nr:MULTISPECIES: CatB-related O-acetyltransferase [Coprobacillaceae]